MNESEKNVINIDSVVRFFGIASAVIGCIVGVYLHFLSMINEVENRITELEKQNIKDEKYKEYAEENRVEVNVIKNDLKSVNETLMEVIRTLRSREDRDYEHR